MARGPLNVLSPLQKSWEPPKSISLPHLQATLSQLGCSCRSSDAVSNTRRVTLTNTRPLWFSFILGLEGGWTNWASYLGEFHAP